MSLSGSGPQEDPPTLPGLEEYFHLHQDVSPSYHVLQMDRYQHLPFFLIPFKKMTSYNICPTHPREPSAPLEPQCYCLNAIQSKQKGLLKLEERYKKKLKKYSKTLDRLVWLNTCSYGLSVASGISSVAVLSTLISLTVSISLGVVSLAGVSDYGVTTALTKKDQKKLTKVTKLVDIVTSALSVFEMPHDLLPLCYLVCYQNE